MCSWSTWMIAAAVAVAGVFFGGWYSLEALANRVLFPAPPRSYSVGDFPMAQLPLVDYPGEEAVISFHEPAQPARRPLVILYCHGNGGDLGRSHAELQRLADGIGAPVAAVEYPGYGVCRGSPTEGSVNRAVLAAVDFLENTLGYPPENIVLYGRSIGSGPASAAAREYARRGRPVAGLVLQSPFLSIRAVVRSVAGNLLASLIAERFDNARELAEYLGPLLVIHGTRDVLIPHQQGEALHELCPAAPELKRLSLAEGADHNRFDIRRQVERPIVEFVAEVLEPRLPRLPQGKPVLEAFRGWRVPAESGREASAGPLPACVTGLGHQLRALAYELLRGAARGGLSAWRRLVG